MTNPDINTAIDNLTALCATAAAALSSPILDVARGDPIPSATGPCVRVSYWGEAAPVKMGTSTLNSEITGERVVVNCYWPVPGSDLAQAQARDRQVFLLKDGIRRGILAHSSLSGAVTDLDVDYGAASFPVVNGTPYRVVSFTVTLEFSEYPISA